MTPQEIEERIPALRTDLLKVAYNRVSPEIAEELVQEVLIKMLDKGQDLQPSALRPYAIKTVCNEVGMHQRGTREGRKVALNDTETGEPIAIPTDATQERVSDAKRTMAIINALAEPYRSVALDILVEGRSQDEAAERAGIPIGSVKSKVNRFREQLQDTLTTRRPMPPSWCRAQPGPRDDLDKGPEPQPGPRMA